MERFISPDELARDTRFKRSPSRNELFRSLPDDVDSVVRVLEKIAPKIRERVEGTALEEVFDELGPGFSFLTNAGAQTELERSPLQLRLQLHGIFVGELQALADAADEWDAAAEDIEAFEVGLEKADITVEELQLVWIPT